MFAQRAASSSARSSSRLLPSRVERAFEGERMIVGCNRENVFHTGRSVASSSATQLEGLQAHALDARPIVDAVERGQQGCQSVVGQEDAASVPASIALAQRVEVDAARRVVRPERGAAGLVLDAERQPHVTGHGGSAFAA